MIRNEAFILRNVAGSQVVIPVGTAAEKFPGMLTLNESGCFLWELLATEQTEQTLVEALLNRYEVSAEQAAEDVQKFLEPLLKIQAVTQ